MHIQYQNIKIRQTGKRCCTQVFGVCQGTSTIACICNKLETCQQHRLIQHHQHILNRLIEQLKTGARLVHNKNSKFISGTTAQICRKIRFIWDHLFSFSYVIFHMVYRKCFYKYPCTPTTFMVPNLN